MINYTITTNLSTISILPDTLLRPKWSSSFISAMHCPKNTHTQTDTHSTGRSVARAGEEHKSSILTSLAVAGDPAALSLSPLGSPTLPRHLINSREIIEAPGLWRSDLNMEMLHYCRSFGREMLERKWKDDLALQSSTLALGTTNYLTIYVLWYKSHDSMHHSA